MAIGIKQKLTVGCIAHIKQRYKQLRFTVVGFPFAFLLSPVFADSLPSAPLRDYPVYVERVPNPNDYNLFANGGWDGNWYVGFNTCWIKKLPPIPAADYERAYIGVKLGRMKLLSNAKNIWDKQPIPGAIYMAIASTTSWTRSESFFVTATEDIPLEGDSESAVEGTGEAQWFWAEVPLHDVDLSSENYLALWSPTPELMSVSSSPVLAAAWGGKEQDTWLTRDIRGAPPRDSRESIGTPISYFQPAMALKLIPKGNPHPITVQIVDWRAGTPDHLRPVVTARVEGDSIERIWLEYFITRPPEPNPRGIPLMNHTWAPIGRPLWKAPYVLTVEQEKLPPGQVQLRVAASNIWGDRGASAPFTVEVSTANAKTK